MLAAASGFVAISWTATPAGAGGPHRPVTHEDFDAATFDTGAAIDNQWTPFVPGTQFVLEGTADRGEGVTVHRVTLTVTDLTKEVNGVQTRVLHDVDESDGVVAEAELAFQAQDDDGNVWLMGEYPEEFADGVFEGAPNTWVSGVDDALAGVAMRADPRPHTSSYFQALIESIEFGDVAEVVGFRKKVCVAVGCFKNVLVIRETNSFAPDEGFQLKFYAAGVGNIRVEFVGGAEQEVLELVEVKVLSPKELKEVREAALRLDRRAYKKAADIYRDTPPAEREQPSKT
jgi:hypothetical protein